MRLLPLGLVSSLLLIACGPAPSTTNLAGYWGFEGDLNDFSTREVIHLAPDGTYDIYPGNERPSESGTWSVNSNTLVLSGGAGSLPIQAFTGTSMTINRAGSARTYALSTRCPALNFRSGDQPFAAYFTFTGTEQNSGYSGFLATDFDSEGELHALIGAVSTDAPDPVYATTRGDGCGMHTFAFPNHGHARMLIDASDTIHVAFAQVKGAATAVALTVTYASRPARDPSAPWSLVELRSNTFVAPLVNLAIDSSGRVAIVSTDDSGRLVAFRRSTPTDEFTSSAIPSEQQLPDEIAVAFDASGAVQVLALYPSPLSLVLYSETPTGWSKRSLQLPDTGPGGASLLGIDFLIEGTTWSLALGDIGTPTVGASIGKLGTLFLGTMTATSEPSWRAVGVGGRARIARDDLGRLHLTSISRLMGTLHTVITGETIERFVGNGGFNPWEPPALATGPSGRVAMGTSVAIAVVPVAGSLKPYKRPLTVSIKGTGAVQSVVPPTRCTESCVIDAEPGRFVELRFPGEKPNYATAIKGPERLPLYCVDSLSSCLQLVTVTPQNSGVDAPGPTVSVTFAPHVVTGLERLGTAIDSWTMMAKPVAVSAKTAFALTRQSGMPLSRLVSWDAAGNALPPFEANDWNFYSAVFAADGSLFMSGRVFSTTVLGSESGFPHNSEVLVGFDASQTVRFVKRLPAGTLVGPLLVNEDGVATLTSSSLLRWSLSGAELPTTTVRASFAAAAPHAIYVATPGNDATTLATIDSAGTLTGSTGVTGVIYALAVDSVGLPVGLLFVKPNAQVGGSSVGSTGGMMVVAYDAQWNVRWKSPVAALGATPNRSFLALAADRRAVAVTQTGINALAAAAFSDTSTFVFPEYGGTGTFVDSGGTVQLYGVTTAGSTISAMAGVSGAVDFRFEKVSTQIGSQIPLRLTLELPSTF